MSSRAIQQEIADAVSLHRRGELIEAARRYQGLLARFPDSADLLNLYGALQLAQGGSAGALQSLLRAASLKPAHAVIACNLGLAHHAQGQLEESRAALERAIQLNPNLIDAWLALAAVHKQSGSLNSALQALDEAIARDAKRAAAHCNRGNLLQTVRRLDAARLSYETAISIDDQLLEAHVGYANCLLAEQKHAEAQAYLTRLAQRWPGDAAVWQGLGNAQLGLGMLGDAVSSFEQALELSPEQIECFISLGVALKRLGRFKEAEVAYTRALAINPLDTSATFNLGMLHQEQRNWPQALAAFDYVIRTNPDHADAHFNRGVLLRWRKRYEDAAGAFTESIRLRPDHAESHYNRAINWLTQGDFDRGWPEYEWRWQLEHIKPSVRVFNQPLWLGQIPLEGKTILLHAEQGLGDTIQFCRFASAVQAKGARVVMEVQPSLYRLLKTLKGVDYLVKRGDPLPDFDTHCPLMSLPLALRVGVSSISGKTYLSADPDLVAQWEQRLGPRHGKRIGLVWSGNPNYSGDAWRSLSLDMLYEGLPPSADFVCLQQALRSDDTPSKLLSKRIRFFGEQLSDFAETAALTACMDHVISVDTSVLHLAGALGITTLAVLPQVSDYRWMGGDGVSTWYDSVSCHPGSNNQPSA